MTRYVIISDDAVAGVPLYSGSTDYHEGSFVKDGSDNIWRGLQDSNGATLEEGANWTANGDASIPDYTEFELAEASESRATEDLVLEALAEEFSLQIEGDVAHGTTLGTERVICRPAREIDDSGDQQSTQGHSGKWTSGVAQLTGSTPPADLSNSYYTVHGLQFEYTGNTFAIHSFGDSGHVITNNLIRATDASAYGIRLRSTGGGHEVHGNVVFGGCAYGISIEQVSGDQYVSHNDVYGCGTNGIQHLGTAANCFAEANYALGNDTDFSGSWSGDGDTDQNISSDATAAALNATKDYGTPAAHDVLESPDEGDGRPTGSRQWPADLIDNANSYEDALNAFAHVDAAMRGSYGVRTNLEDAGSQGSNGFSWSTGTTRYLSFFMKFSSDAARTGSSRAIQITDGATLLAYLEPRNLDSDPEMRLTIREPSIIVAGDFVSVSLDTKMWVTIMWDSVTAGNKGVEWWIDGVSQGSESTLDYSSNEMDGFGYGYNVNGLSAGYVYFDQAVPTSTRPGEPDDATSPYGNEFKVAVSPTADYYDNNRPTAAPANANDFPERDSTGAKWSDKPNTFHIGTENYSLEPAPSGDTITLGLLEAIAELNDPTLTPGAKTLSLGNLEAIGELNDPTVSPGAKAVSLGLLEAIAELNDPVLSAGGVSITLPLLEAIAELNDVVPSSTAASISLGLLEAIGELNDLTPTPGGASVTLGLLEVIAELNDVTPTPGAVTVVIEDLEAIAEMHDLALTGGPASIALGILEAIAELNTPSFSAVVALTGIVIKFSAEGPTLVFAEEAPSLTFTAPPGD